MNLFLKRVTFQGVTLFLLLMCAFLQPLKGNEKSDKVKIENATLSENIKKSNDTFIEISNRVQELVLVHNRDEALDILQNQLRIEKPDTKKFKNLLDLYKKIYEMFFSEKSQQNYEMAIAVYQSDKNQSKEKLLEAIKIEGKNFQVLKALIFTFLSLKDCGSAKQYLIELKKYSDYDHDYEKLQFLNLVCSKNKSEAVAIVTKMDPDKVLSSAFWLVNKYRLNLQEGDLLKERIDGAGEYPELVYVLWKMAKNIKEKSNYANKYKQLCQSPMPYDKAIEYWDPWVCEHVKEVLD